MYGFPRKTFKGLAGTQLAIGLFCILIGIADIAITISILSGCEDYHVDEHRRKHFDDMDDDWDKKHWDDDDDHWDKKRDRRDTHEEDEARRKFAHDGGRRRFEELFDDDDKYLCKGEDYIFIPSYYVAGIWVGLLVSTYQS